MSQLKVMYHPWHNLLYQQHNVECHTIFDVLEYCAGDCIFFSRISQVTVVLIHPLSKYD